MIPRRKISFWIFILFLCICIELLPWVFPWIIDQRELRSTKAKQDPGRLLVLTCSMGRPKSTITYYISLCLHCICIEYVLYLCCTTCIAHTRSMGRPHNNSKWHTLTAAPFRLLTSGPFETCGTNYVVKKIGLQRGKELQISRSQIRFCPFQCAL